MHFHCSGVICLGAHSVHIRFCCVHRHCIKYLETKRGVRVNSLEPPCLWACIAPPPWNSLSHFLVLELREPMGTCLEQYGTHNHIDFLLWNYMCISCNSAAVFNMLISYISYNTFANQPKLPNHYDFHQDDRVAYHVWRLLHLALYWASPTLPSWKLKFLSIYMFPCRNQGGHGGERCPASSPVHAKNGGAPGTNCLHMHLISPRCGMWCQSSDSI